MLAPESKKAIGAKTADLIGDNSSLIINIDTTTEQVALFLKDHHGLEVITNNVNLVHIMKYFSGCELFITGGMARKLDVGIVGVSAVDFINQFKVDYAVIGVSAIDEDGSLLDYDYREVKVAQAIIANARHVILVADKMKLDRKAPVRIGDISQISTVVTDYDFPEKLKAVCAENGVELVVTDLESFEGESNG